ncbi:TadE family type IV pilus minor pilin [Tomitella gaofuii]|uniref:TadE family type IV pilus minor pilin n=1 Tax=Tomitella gaofuii TaxID=2760083 RepID=UPI0015FC630B|nr:TadE family type IV pilus minor pilin [Tomitella gaofuii]
MATVEAAIALAALVLVVAACAAAVMTVVTQVRCVDAAREVARLAARADGRAVDAGRRMLPDARIDVTTSEGMVVAVVSVDAPVLPMSLSATSAAVVEPGSDAG